VITYQYFIAFWEQLDLPLEASTALLLVVVTSQEYESVLEQYSLSPAELESGFTRIASITFAHNTKRATSSASELGRNVLSQDVEKMRQRYDKLLATLKRK